MLHRRSPSIPRANPSPTSTLLLRSLAFVGILVAVLVAPQPSFAAWEGTAAEDVTAKVVDAVLVRPLAAVRVAVGVALFLPASLLASPGGREGISISFGVLIDAPIEYAFERELGDF